MALIATKMQRYGTRALKAGDEFPAVTPRRRRLLIKLGKARETEPGVKRVECAAKPAEPAASAGEYDIAALRAEYEAVVGKRPFMGWDADTLRQKMAEAASGGED